MEGVGVILDFFMGPQMKYGGIVDFVSQTFNEPQLPLDWQNNLFSPQIVNINLIFCSIYFARLACLVESDR